ncbi:hypothetical protein Tsubulata_023636 [Turnera subulata]|uniref:Secreted protein n=1 Tax=Turnera subulata TaxID=218843 RepID=A0A9Q0JG98_9ROSI|nr:hypothetical protein Tsubulata_023636 [Turnera subulata]
MKKSGFFAASVAAASATAMSCSSSSPNATFSCNSNIPFSHQFLGQSCFVVVFTDAGKESSSGKDQQRSASADKFAPRFDGLRFIETLVTAHR